MAVAIDIKGLNKFYKLGRLRRQVLKNVSVEIQPGQIFGLLGPNGAGKTKLLKAVVGISRPDQGQVLVMGKSPADKESRSCIGYLPERPYFQDFLTAKEFLEFHGKLALIPDAQLNEQIKKVLDEVGLSQSSAMKLKTYSKGMLQRLGVAQALIQDPRVLVLDEPMSGLDPRGRRELREIMKKISSSGKTILFTTHNISDVAELCNECGFMRAGELDKMNPSDARIEDFYEETTA